MILKAIFLFFLNNKHVILPCSFVIGFAESSSPDPSLLPLPLAKRALMHAIHTESALATPTKHALLSRCQLRLGCFWMHGNPDRKHALWCTFLKCETMHVALLLPFRLHSHLHISECMTTCKKTHALPCVLKTKSRLHYRTFTSACFQMHGNPK